MSTATRVRHLSGTEDDTQRCYIHDRLEWLGIETLEMWRPRQDFNFHVYAYKVIFRLVRDAYNELFIYIWNFYSPEIVE